MPQRTATIIAINQPYPTNQYNQAYGNNTSAPFTTNTNYNNTNNLAPNQPYVNTGTYNDYTLGLEKNPTVIKMDNVDDIVLPVLPSAVVPK